MGELYLQTGYTRLKYLEYPIRQLHVECSLVLRPKDRFENSALPWTNHRRVVYETRWITVFLHNRGQHR